MLVLASQSAGRKAVLEAAGREVVDSLEAIPSGSVEGRPRLTEPWFC